MNENAEVIETTGEEMVTIGEVPATGTLFRTDDPALVLERAKEVANALKPVLVEQKMIVQIQQKEHVTIEGWQTLGAMLGVTPVIEWTHPIPALTQAEKGWEARCLAKTIDGRTIGAGEGECLRSESRWEKADDYAVRSMAQTRAQSKALASVLRFVVTLAGYSGTPAEEMPKEGFADTGEKASEKQRGYLWNLIDRSPLSSEAKQKFIEWARTDLTKDIASSLISELKDNPEKGAQAVAQAAKFSDMDAYLDTEGLGQEKLVEDSDDPL